jgi:hypothetical protein
VVPFIVQEWGPGSAVSAEGEFLKGVGAAYDGIGNLATGLANYRRQSAESDAIETDAAIGLNEYLHRSLVNADLARGARVLVKKERRNRGQDAARARILYDPSDHDIESGDALNALARELTGPHVPPPALRAVAVRLPDGLLPRLPLHLARAGLVIAPQRLRAQGRWPNLLQGPAYARRRRAYEQAVEAALEQGARGILSRAAVAAIDESIGELRNGCESAARTAPPTDQVNARVFVDGLSKSARMLHQPAAVAALAAVLSDSATTVPEALELMRQHNLRFGATASPDERTSYRELYPLLVEQTDRLVEEGLRQDRRPAPASSQGGEGRTGSRR